jgi:hypothetical protein
MMQGDQGGTYLARQSRVVRKKPWIISVHVVAKTEADDMAGPVAAPDAAPAAAVLVTFVPRGKAPSRVAGDASLEGQQGVPLGGYAGATSGMATNSSWRQPQCLRLRGGGGGCEKEKQVQDGGGMHGHGLQLSC